MKSVPYSYLAFRRVIVFLDEWLSYGAFLWIYYYIGERSLLILAPIFICIFLFNLIGYIYLGYLENHYDIYGFHKPNHQTTPIPLPYKPHDSPGKNE